MREPLMRCLGKSPLADMPFLIDFALVCHCEEQIGVLLKI